MADTPINALRDKLMLLAYLQRNRPICTEVGVRPVEEPQADHQAHHTRAERTGGERVLCEPEHWRRDPDQRDEESDPGENQEACFQGSLIACGDLDSSTPVAVWRANGDQHYCTYEH